MQNLIQKFKDHVIQEAQKPSFKHHKWFVKYHLEITEKIGLELCEKYTNADKNLVLLLLWLHDYGKIVDFDHQHEATLDKGKQKLLALGFPIDFTNKVISYIKILDEKTELTLPTTPIEVKIVSSADGASHLIGPFFPIWLYENPDDDLETLMQSNIQKVNVDWDKKIVLPEVKKAFEDEYNFQLMQNGLLPSKFFN